MKNHIMIDIETMGNKSNSIITSISAIPFDIKTGEISLNFFDKYILIDSCVDKNLKFNSSTVLWWMNQDDKTRKKFINGQKIGIDLEKVLKLFRNWLKLVNLSINEKTINELYVWGNSPRFDMGILSNAYNSINMEIPWDFRNERDVRTIVGFSPHIKYQEPFIGVPHYGIDDCKHQIKYLVKSLNLLKLN